VAFVDTLAVGGRVFVSLMFEGAQNSALNTRRPSILVVSWHQFGYHTDSFEYCRHLRERFELTYLCVDQGLSRKHLNGVDVVISGPPIAGKVEPRLAVDAIRLLRRRSFDLAFLQRFKFAFVVRLLSRSIPVVFDIRSGSIERSSLIRAYQNSLIRWNARCFDHITVISSGLAEQLRLPRRAHVLPLGADPADRLVPPRRDGLRLVYIGTFTNRALDRTVEGLAIFVGRRRLPCSYTVVGFGSDQERATIRAAIERFGLTSTVTLQDRVDHDELPALLDAHNVGVAFTPRVPWYEHQPSTKIFEYLQNGLLCLATDNAVNREIVSGANGVLVDDTPEGFARGLDEIAGKLSSWRPEAVAATVRSSTWANIVHDNIEPYLERALHHGRRRGRSR
jgi:glycosyltransferase involved in cell wall biosynthesis